MKTENVIVQKEIFVNGYKVDARSIMPELLASKLHEAAGVEANVATGYHAIEFLPWGQDLNKTPQESGKRPYTDYHKEKCTGQNCDKRALYLKNSKLFASL